MAARPGADLANVPIRIGAPIALGVLADDPAGLSRKRRAAGRPERQLPRIALAGAIRLNPRVVHARATPRATGAPGTALAAAAMWVPADAGLLALDADDAAHWTALTGPGVAVGIGLSWAHLRRAPRGRADVDDADA